MALFFEEDGGRKTRRSASDDTDLFAGGGQLLGVLLPELLRFVGLPDAVAANLRQIIYGLSLILVVYFRPQGLFGKTVMR